MINQMLLDVTVRLSNIAAISEPIKEIIDFLIVPPFDTVVMKMVDIIVAHFSEIVVSCA